MFVLRKSIFYYNRQEELSVHALSERLPYYFCEMCGKVYLTQDELIEHRFSSQDKTPQQMQSSGHIDSFFKQGAVQDDGDTLVTENDLNQSSTAETSAASETVTRKNEVDKEVDSKKVGSVLLLLLS